MKYYFYCKQEFLNNKKIFFSNIKQFGNYYFIFLRINKIIKFKKKWKIFQQSRIDAVVVVLFLDKNHRTITAIVHQIMVHFLWTQNYRHGLYYIFLLNFFYLPEDEQKMKYFKQAIILVSLYCVKYNVINLI